MFSKVKKVGIIGSAGRKADAKKMTKGVYDAMMAKAEEVITQHFKLDLNQVHLVSGGAAWADHIAVVLHVKAKVCGLTLHLPTQWHDRPTPHFHDNQKSNIMLNPGRSANRLHKQFGEKIGENTLEQIQSSAFLGAKFKVHDGFKERNTAVARESQYLVAFTWNEGSIPKKSSGTNDTWQKHMGQKIHIPIGSLVDEKGRALLDVASTGTDSSEGACCSKTDSTKSVGEQEKVPSDIGTSSSEATNYSTNTYAPQSCSSSGESLEENPKYLQHQGESTDSGCFSGDSQSFSTLESPGCTSSFGKLSHRGKKIMHQSEKVNWII